jgi:Holliday junction resolvase
MVNSRRKGATAELELARVFTDAGVPSRRSVQYCGRAGDADITCDGLDLHIEVKRVEKFRLAEAIAQASRDANGKPWVVVHRGSRMPWLVIQTFDQWAADSVRFREAKAANAKGDGDAAAAEAAG